MDGAGTSNRKTIDIVDKLETKLIDLQGIVSNALPSRRETGGIAGLATLRHHSLGTSKCQEFANLVDELRETDAVVFPNDKIYINPGMVPTILSTRSVACDQLGSNAASRLPARPEASCKLGDVSQMRRQPNFLVQRLLAQARQDEAEIISAERPLDNVLAGFCARLKLDQSRDTRSRSPSTR